VDADWTYFAEYYTHKNRPTMLRAVYRTRPRQGGTGGTRSAGNDDFIFTKGGWRPSPTFGRIRLGLGDHEAVEISEDEAERLTEQIRRERLELLRAGVADLTAILRRHGMTERAEQIEVAHASISGGPHIEEQLYDLVTDTPVPDSVRDEETVVRFNRAAEVVQQMTQESQR
jgi:hypothetical protein